MEKVTIRDVAEAAGVSITTISFAFNNPERLPENTVRRILKLAEELNYSPDPIARSMTSGRTNTLGILLANPFNEIFYNPFLYEFLEGFGETCASANFSIKMIPPREDGFRQSIIDAAVDGIITLGVDPSDSVMVALNQRGVPFVMVDTDPIDNVPTINIEDQKGAFRQMEYILSEGHRNIAVFGIRSGFRGKFMKYIGTLRRRMDGYLEALKKYDLDLDGNQIRLVESPCSFSGGKRAFERAWDNSPKPTAFVCMADIIAFGAISAASDYGLQIPRDLSVIGFDDVILSSITNPPLTTIRQPLRRKGKLAAEMLMRHIEGNLEPVNRILRTQLIVRESVMPPSQ